ncbi:MAG TPA: HAD hydrolase family protein [Longilinea sp.]|nr:HAD hydrolase family protein [Longilinea sp.]
MIEIDIPGRGHIQIKHLVLDVNGTLAVDGVIPDSIAAEIMNLKKLVEIHLLTADTHGRQAEIDQQLELTATRIQPGNEGAQKAAYVRQLNPATVIAIGQGANDAEMLREAAIGVCVLSPEGTAVSALHNADVLAADIHQALALLGSPNRLKATLRL